MNTVLKKTIFIAMASVLPALLSTSARAGDVVKLGYAGPLTGGAAHLGKDVENGARLAVEEINAHGLIIGGKPITLQLDAQDDAGDPRTATQVAQMLVDDKVVAVVGDMQSGTSIAASKVYSDAGILQITPSATNPLFTQQGFRTTYRVVATDAQQGPALARYAVTKMRMKTVAVVDDSTAYGTGLASEFEKTAKALGATVVSHDATSDKAIDFRAILTKIKGENPDAVMFGGMDATGGPFAKQAKQLGLRAAMLFGDGACTEQLANLAGDAVGNVVCSEAGMPLSMMDGGKAFQTRYEKRFNQPIQIYSPFSYDAVYIIVDAMKRADSTDPARILSVLSKTNFKGITGTATFDAKGDLQHGVISLYDYKQTKRRVLDVMTM